MKQNVNRLHLQSIFLYKYLTPQKSLFALGYAGWFEGQLEEELLNDGWLVAPGNSKLIFECKAEKKWGEAIKSIGINPDFLSLNSGKC